MRLKRVRHPFSVRSIDPAVAFEGTPHARDVGDKWVTLLSAEGNDKFGSAGEVRVKMVERDASDLRVGQLVAVELHFEFDKLRDVEYSLGQDPLADVQTSCSCGGPWPCTKVRWWNRWRHDEVVDVARLISKEIEAATRRSVDNKLLGGE